VKDLEGWMISLSNWGRWGPDDELGAVNLITSEKRRQAAALARTGAVVSLMRGMTIMAGATENALSMIPSISPGGFASDRIDISFHGYQITHMDALCHFSHNGKSYNGYPFNTVVTPDGGCVRLGIGKMKDRIFTRGVLVDIPRLKGLPYLEPGTHVYREDVEAWEKRVGIRIGPGDAMLLRTGRWARDSKLGPQRVPSGYDLSFVPFFKERDVAVIGSDWTQDVGTIVGVQYPVHHFAIVALGMTLLDDLALDELAAKAAALNRWEFLLTVAPTNALNGTGAPVNPLAVF
jgi:kynurenine formamidase